MSSPYAPVTPPEPPAAGAFPAARRLPIGTSLRQDANIQGNVLAAFNKDFQAFLLLRFPTQGTEAARVWLQELLPRISTNDRVAAFNEAFSAAKRLSGSDPADMSAQWVNMSLTGAGLKALAPDTHLGLSTQVGIDEGVAAWLVGAAAVALTVGDVETSAPDHWLFGSGAQWVDAIVAVAADRREDLEVALANQRELAARHDMTVVFEQHGETLLDTARGHEHFGFKDGVSQPGVIGFDEPSDEPDRADQVQGKHGTDLIAPGEFVLGYPRHGDPAAGRPVPQWMWDGSFLVFRRLAQDVPSFWADLEHAFVDLADEAKVGANGIAAVETLAARLVGRWRNGTPTDQCPVSDVPLPADPGINDFDFSKDPDGVLTPHGAHIRKVYPRKGAEPVVTEADAERRRILRRGIPFGEIFEPASGHGHGVDTFRGLIFQCYQSSLVDQFMFLQESWVNEENFSSDGAGRDAVIGNASDIRIPRAGGAATVSLKQWVSTQGAVFAFTPSISALKLLAAGETLPIN